MTEELSTPRRGRRFAAVLAGILALGIVPFAFPASSQADAEPELRDITVNACPVDDQGTDDPADDTTEVPEDPFTDTDGTTFEFEIRCVAWYDVTSGATATTYNPFGEVSRGQMATFIANLVEYVDPGALDGASDDTDDFPCPSDPTELDGNIHEPNVQLLADAGIVRGGPGDLPADCYGPDLLVTRAQMASFIAQAQVFLDEAIAPLPATSSTVAGATTTTVADTLANYFDDDDDSVHHRNINAIASEGIVVGTSDRTYRPGDDIERGQMAAFLARKLDYLIEEGDTETPPPAATITATAEPTSVTAAAGGPVDLTITPSAGTVESASVTGCGLAAADVTSADEDTAAAGFQAEVTIPAGTAGTCDLTVVATLDDDSTATDTVTITRT